MIDAMGRHGKKRFSLADPGASGPTISVFPHTTVGDVEIPMGRMKYYKRDDSHKKIPMPWGKIVDTPGIEGDSSFLYSFIDPQYSNDLNLFKVIGFKRIPQSLRSGIIPKRI
jgi:hypothetical protein